MKKTIPITIAGQLFYIEEDAYEKLSDYLESVKAHFASYADSAEIIADIESRIAEQFLQNSAAGKDKIVTIENVDKLIEIMGKAEDFDDEASSTKSQVPNETFQESVKKRLYRDPDNAVIAGVASGIAAYFGVEPAVVRLIFVLVVLLGGSGILVYIVLWLVMPEAKTNTEKLQMRGQAVTLESVNEMVKEKVDEVKKNKSRLGKILAFPFIVLGTVLKWVFFVARKLVGIIISLSAIFGLFWLVFVFAVTLFNIHSPFVDFPIAEAVTGPLFYLGLVAAFFAAFIPLVFLMLTGISLNAKRNLFKPAPSSILLGLWFVALITLGVVGSKVAPQYQDYIHNNPAYQQTTQDYTLSNFQKISVHNDVQLTIAQGSTYKVWVSGRTRDIGKLELTANENELIVRKNNKFSLCIFCEGGRLTVHVQMPKLVELKAENATKVSSENLLTTEQLALSLSNASSANLRLTTKKITISQENVSYLKLEGSADEATIDLSNASDLEAKNFAIKTATVTAHNGSSAEIYVSNKLIVSTKNGSSIVYYGNPQTQQEAKNGSRIRQAPASPTSTVPSLNFSDEIPEIE